MYYLYKSKSLIYDETTRMDTSQEVPKCLSSSMVKWMEYFQSYLSTENPDILDEKHMWYMPDVCLFLRLLNDSVNCIGYTESDDKIITNGATGRMWKETVMTYARFPPCIYMEGVRKTRKTSGKIANLWAKIQVWNLINMNQECWTLNCSIWYQPRQFTTIWGDNIFQLSE